MRQMWSMCPPASSISILMLAMVLAVWAVASPTWRDSRVSRSWETWPRRNTVAPRATTPWQRSLSSFCSG